MSQYSITVSEVSKRFVRQRSFGGLLLQAMPWPVGWLAKKRGGPLFTAIEPVSFKVGRGEAFGLIGPNGSGKSTMLKIIAEITPPTTGSVTRKGSIGSLIEVGAGFHPELTGRENIYLKSAIMGMPQAQVKKLFDEIVAFAELEDFIDIPVKRYSSGMYVRLGFSTVVHQTPDILLIDEILAVGDVNFQNKCFNRLQTLKREHGTSFILVSHNMRHISHFCNRAAVFNKGALKFIGDSDEAVQQYFQLMGTGETEASTELNTTGRSGSGEARITVIEIVNVRRPGSVLMSGEPFEIRFTIQGESDISDSAITLGFLSPAGERIVTFSNRHETDPHAITRGEHHWRVYGDAFPLLTGEFKLVAMLTDKKALNIIDLLPQALAFKVNTSLEVQKASCYNGMNGWFHFDYDFSYSSAKSGHAKETES